MHDGMGWATAHRRTHTHPQTHTYTHAFTHARNTTPLCPCAGAGDANEVLNSRAVAVMTRMSDKLMGRDYTVDGMSPPSENDSVIAQVSVALGTRVHRSGLSERGVVHVQCTCARIGVGLSKRGIARVRVRVHRGGFEVGPVRRARGIHRSRSSRAKHLSVPRTHSSLCSSRAQHLSIPRTHSSSCSSQAQLLVGSGWGRGVCEHDSVCIRGTCRHM